MSSRLFGRHGMWKKMKLKYVQYASRSFFAFGEDTHTLRLTNKLVDLRTGYVHRHPVARSARNRVQIQSLHIQRKNKGHHVGVLEVTPGYSPMAKISHLSRYLASGYRLERWICEPASLSAKRTGPLQIQSLHIQKKKTNHTTRVSGGGRVFAYSEDMHA